MYDLGKLILELRRDEGVRNKPYRDTVGKFTIGVGRNLDDVGLRYDEIDYLLKNDINDIVRQLGNTIPWVFTILNDVRQRAIINMAFNLGVAGLLQFKTMLTALKSGLYDEAADAALHSKWAIQVGDRAKRIAEMIRNG
jgi:lysozyme